ncbi:MAG TPA: PIG-L family deacetylase, partial [Acidimicrobiia bacterium]|nr:PIG-L family deacetylase [Acidimicrobiia bacterium]
MPATLVCFHAHPDDEAITTAGVMAQAAANGHRVVLVLATRGELGEVDDDVLAPGETLGDRRDQEARRSAAALGAARVEFLGYHDSGMMGEPTNDAAEAFWSADVDVAAARLAEILRIETADVLTVYDERGGYGHPDHIQVHRVGVRAAELAGTARVYEATTNRDHVRRMFESRAAEAADIADDMPDPVDIDTFGTPEAEITTGVDVREFVTRKRAAMAAHASQISDSSFFMTMPDDVFREAFGWE